MKCEDCDFDYSETGNCPHCGHDPSVDLLAAVRLPSPPIANPLETEFAMLCKEVEEGRASKARARQHWETVTERASSGNRDAQHLVARMALSQKDYPTALRLLTALADRGHALAQLDLGKMYDEGLGTEQDVFKAIKFFRLAAAQGNPIALFFLARQHLPGGFLRENPAAANALMQELATVHPTLFRRNNSCPSCSGCHGSLSDVDFAKKTASQLGTMIKYAVIAAIIAIIIAIVKSEL